MRVRNSELLGGIFKSLFARLWLVIAVGQLVLFTPNLVLAEKTQLQREIRTLDRGLEKEEKKAAAIRGEVRELEKKLGVQTRKMYSLNKKINKLDKRLLKATGEKEALDQQLNVQKKGLSQQMQALYSAGEQSHLRLLLKQDDPSDIGRTVKYFEYLNKSRIKEIKKIRLTLSKVQMLEKKIAVDHKELKRLKTDLLVEQMASKNTLKQRTFAYKKINKKVSSKKKALSRLRRKEAKLQAKIDRLVARTQAESKNAEIKRVAKKNIKKSQPTQQSTQQKKSAKQVGGKQRFVANRKFSTLRGKLSWPVKGRLSHSYGERRNEKQRWKGVVISASGGKKVHAVATGKVEFSGWFNGYGYLVIIRHDNNYRSLYGYNRAIYVKTGQIVKGGATIAAVGNSGGQQQNALYFEIRKGTRPRNPAKWCR